MYNRNHVDLIGNVGKIEIRTGKKDVAVLSIATNERFTDNEGKKQTATEWHQVVAFSPKLVELAQKFIAKGDLLSVTGALRTTKFTDSEGKDRYSTEIVAKNFGFLSPKRDDADADSGDEQPED
jgi:single-strand DNA-binding protein|tara:strand:- start:2508 stop:2879 length:372 start_codon:yes stop_codon:yes gene_type:complete